MRYLSVCSGIEAASVAWGPLGWTPVGFSEIEPLPCAVLAHRFGSNLPGEPWSGNAPPNFGDMTKFKEWPDAAFDVLVGGTPCQSFSVAGLRKGLADPRGNLALTYLAIVDRYRPEWLLWENVPGVLSSGGGRDFGAFLGGLGQLGYGFAYRVLDAQFIRIDGFGRAVPQRRRRVFVVGHSDWRRAAAVLFDPASLYGDSAPRREAGEGIAGSTSASSGRRGGVDEGDRGGLIASTGGVSHCLNAGGMGRQDYETETLIAHSLTASRSSTQCSNEDATLVPVAFNWQGGGTQTNLGFDPRSGVTGSIHVGQTPAIAFSCKDHGADATNEVAPTMRSMGHAESHANAGGQLAVAFDMRGREGGAQFEGPHETANIRAASGGSSRSYVAQQWAVRRLTPTECERLQGFPDGWTDVPFRGKPAADGPRYKALGNSMAVNCIRWIGRRMETVSAIGAKLDAAE